MFCLAMSVVALPEASAQSPKRSSEDASAVIARARQWAQGYLEALPNFTCRKTNRIFMGPAIPKPKLQEWVLKMPRWANSKQGAWRRERPRVYMPGVKRRGGSTLGPKGSNRRIHDSEWLVRMVKGEGESYEWIRGSRDGYGRGYFASWLTELFREELQTRFEWIEDAQLRGYGVHVFRTVTPRDLYQYGEYGVDEVILVGFEGTIYIDRDTGRVLRYVAEEPIGLTKGHRVKSGRMLFDYDYIEIGDETVLLPARSLIYTKYRRNSTLEETEFHDYQQFKSETKLDFGAQ